MPTAKRKPIENFNIDRRRVTAEHKDDGRTEQHHARSCDINTIMRRYLKTGVIDHHSRYSEVYGDVSAADYQESMALVAKVKTEFEDLPAYIRAEFNQNSEEYLAAMQTDEGVERLRSTLHPAERYEKDGSPEGTAQKADQATEKEEKETD